MKDIPAPMLSTAPLRNSACVPLLLAALTLGGCAARAAAAGPGSPATGALPALPDGRCGGFERRALAGPTDLLSHRLSIRPLQGTRDMARPVDIMSAPPSDESETRLFLEDGGRKLVVFVQELFARSTPDLVTALRAMDDRFQDTALAPVTLPSGLRGVRAVDLALDTSGEAVPVVTLVSIAPDDTLQVLRVFVNQAVVAAGAEGCAALAWRLLATVEPGPRRLALAAGPRALGDGYTLDVPAGFALVARPGPDFDVYRVLAVRPLGTPAAELGVYFGHHPSFHPDSGKAQSAGRLLGRDVTWYETAEEGKVRREALVRLDGGLSVHFFLTAAGVDDAAELTRVAATLRATHP